MNTLKTFLLMITAGLLMNPGVQAAELYDSLDAKSKAYVALVRADEAYRRQAYREALTEYTTAVRYYKEVALKEPDWQPRVLQYRLAYCENRIESIRAEADLSAQPAVAAPSTRDAEYHAVMQQNEYLQRKLTRLQTTLQEQEEGAEETEANQKRIATLLRQVEELQADRADMQTRLSSRTNALAALAELSNTVTAAQRHSLQLSATVSALEEEKMQMEQAAVETADLLTQHTADKQALQEQLATQEKQLRERQKTIDFLESLRSENAELQQDLEEAEAAADQARDELKAAGKTIQDLEKEEQKLTESIERQRQDIGSLEQQKQALEERAKKLMEKALEQEESLTKEQSARQEAEEKLAASLERQKAMKAEIEQLKETAQQVTDLQDELQDCRKKAEELQNYTDRFREERDDAIRKAQNLIRNRGDHEDTMSKLETTIELQREEIHQLKSRIQRWK